MSVIDSAKAHFESLGIQSIEVPEWKDTDGKPSMIYWNPINLYEKNLLFKKSDNMSDVSILADILVMKALDKDDKGELQKAFKPEDKFALRKKADSNIVATVANKILLDTSFEEAEKK